MPREAEAECHRRPSAVGGNRYACVQVAFGAQSVHDDAGDATRAVRFDDRSAHHDARLEHRAGVHRLLQQQPVQIAPQHRAPVQAAGIRSGDRDPVLAGDDHALDAQPAFLDAGRHAEPAKDRERPGVDGIAAQLRTRKRFAIDEADTRAGAREQHRGNGARRAGADDDDVIDHLVLAVTLTKHHEVHEAITKSG